MTLDNVLLLSVFSLKFAFSLVLIVISGGISWIQSSGGVVPPCLLCMQQGKIIQFVCFLLVTVFKQALIF